MGMSGVGKTRVASMLRREAGWFHYSADYRIGTRYLGEAIADEFKREAMKTPALREMLLSDSIYIASNITFDNLAPLSAFLGKPGDPAKGGIAFEEYLRRQRLHREAEISALLDAPLFVEKAKSIYGYQDFICDAGGSICEVVDPEDKNDRVLNVLSETCTLVYIAGDAAHADALKARFAKYPKPMYYNEAFLKRIWAEYLAAKRVTEREVDPDDFIRSGFAQLIDWRRPRYEAIARNWGVTVSARDVEKAATPAEFLNLVERA
ncbi:MAG: ATPase [Pseudomonadota bacterium]